MQQECCREQLFRVYAVQSCMLAAITQGFTSIINTPGHCEQPEVFICYTILTLHQCAGNAPLRGSPPLGKAFTHQGLPDIVRPSAQDAFGEMDLRGLAGLLLADVAHAQQGHDAHHAIDSDTGIGSFGGLGNGGAAVVVAVAGAGAGIGFGIGISLTRF